MARLRSEMWVAAFVRRHNQQGRICVVARKGDAAAGQIWVEVDHLNGTASLFVPAPAGLGSIEGAERAFVCRFEKTDPADIRERIARETEFDPDLWVVVLEARDAEHGLTVGADS